MVFWYVLERDNPSENSKPCDGRSTVSNSLNVFETLLRNVLYWLLNPSPAESQKPLVRGVADVDHGAGDATLDAVAVAPAARTPGGVLEVEGGAVGPAEERVVVDHGRQPLGEPFGPRAALRRDAGDRVGVAVRVRRHCVFVDVVHQRVRTLVHDDDRGVRVVGHRDGCRCPRRRIERAVGRGARPIDDHLAAGGVEAVEAPGRAAVHDLPQVVDGVERVEAAHHGRVTRLEVAELVLAGVAHVDGARTERVVVVGAGRVTDPPLAVRRDEPDVDLLRDVVPVAVVVGEAEPVAAVLPDGALREQVVGRLGVVVPGLDGLVERGPCRAVVVDVEPPADRARLAGGRARALRRGVVTERLRAQRRGGVVTPARRAAVRPTRCRARRPQCRSSARGRPRCATSRP